MCVYGFFQAFELLRLAYERIDATRRPVLGRCLHRVHEVCNYSSLALLFFSKNLLESTTSKRLLSTDHDPATWEPIDGSG